jgi:hypothetical protein
MDGLDGRYNWHDDADPDDAEFLAGSSSLDYLPDGETAVTYLGIYDDEGEAIAAEYPETSPGSATRVTSSSRYRSPAGTVSGRARPRSTAWRSISAGCWSPITRSSTGTNGRR